MESCEFAHRLQARRLNELVDDLRHYSPDRLGALETMLKQPESKWFSVEGVAAELSVSKETVRRWIRSGQLKTVRAGRQYRISPDDLRAFLEQHSQHEEKSTHDPRPRGSHDPG